MDLTNKTVLISDCEYNNIDAYNATKIWCITSVDFITGETFKFHPEKEGGDQFHDQFGQKFVDFAKKYDVHVGHNWHGAEGQVFKKLLGWCPDPETVIDTLVWSRTLRPLSPSGDDFPKFKQKGWDTRMGGHSLKAWGQRLGHAKIEFDNFAEFTFAQLDYCMNDSLVNVLILKELLKEKKEFGFSDLCLATENMAHYNFMEQVRNGFTLHKERSQKLADETQVLIENYKAELHKIFPERKVLEKVYTPKYLKGSTEMNAISKKYLLNHLHEANPDGTFNIYYMETFNPDSPAQVGSRLMEIGWKPRKFTATGQPSTGKDVIGEAIDQLADKYPEVEVLRKYNVVVDKNEKGRKWLTLCDENDKVHGRINHIGPWTHRCSHFDDNMANITKVRLDKDGHPVEGLEGNFGWDCRHCWIPRKDWKLVGYDASGIQLRALAHYMADQDYIEQVIHGDIHVVNQKAAGIKDRPTAKTFIYAWLLGAGDKKIGIIVGCDESEFEELFNRARATQKYNRFREHQKHKGHAVLGVYDNLLFYVADKLRDEGRKADKDVVARILKGFFTKRQFLESLPALKRFKEVDIKQAAKDGFMYGMDGRKIWVPSEHLAMGAYLQGFEAVIMKTAMNISTAKLKAEGVPFGQCAHVHDEAQIECPPDVAEYVGKTCVWAIEEAGRRLGSLCPLTGEFRIGDSWALTH